MDTTRTALATLVALTAQGCIGDATEHSETREELVSPTPPAYASEAAAGLGDLSSLVADYAESRRAEMPVAERDARRAVELATGAPFDQLHVSWTGRGVVSTLSAADLRIRTASASSGTPEEVAEGFLADYGHVLGLADASSELRLVTRVGSRRDRTVLRYAQESRGRPVFGSIVVVHVRQGGDIGWVYSRVAPSTLLPSSSPTAGADDARAGVDDAELGYFDPMLFGRGEGDPRLAWRVLTSDEYVFIDATTNETLLRRRLADADMHREILTCAACTDPSQLPGALRHDDVCHSNLVGCVIPGPLCSSPASCSGPDVCDPDTFCAIPDVAGTAKIARNATESVYNYLVQRFGRDGWDDGALPIYHRMRVSVDADNSGDGMSACQAMWRPASAQFGAAQVVTGSARTCPDVVTHEFMHGVDQAEGDISGDACTQSHAIQEGMSDVFGELAERLATGSGPDWVHGAGCPSCISSRNTNLASPPSFNALCDGRAPALGGCGVETTTHYRPQPDTWSEYRPECGGHWNSSIASRIGWVMGREPSLGAAVVHGIPVSGVGEAEASGVWYRAMVEDLGGSVTFTDLRAAIQLECFDLYARFGAAAYINCTHAASSAGLWWSFPIPDLSLPASFELQNFGSGNRRFVFYYSAAAGRLAYRTQTGCTFSTCAWSAESLGEMMPEQQPAAAFVPSPSALFVCYRNTGNGVWCDRWDGTSWHAGPDPGGTGVTDSVGLAYFNGALYLAYRKNDAPNQFRIYWRRLLDGTFSWSPEQSTGYSATLGPSLASGDEDFHVADSNELWMVFPNGASGAAQGQIVFRRFDASSQVWGGGGVLSTVVDEGTPFPLTQYYRTAQRVMAAFHRGRLHLVATNVGLDAFGSGQTLWYGSCAPPCGPSDRSRFVQQEGVYRESPYVGNSSTGDGYLRILYRQPAGDGVHNRSKYSD
ncbi:MAG: M4 family metallopeptidase [Sandaracinaceae bacterium]|nr:M4 family metallopeptidase [Sandaracinaceae bacterium]